MKSASCDVGDCGSCRTQINDGDTLYQEYTKISEPDRTPEQRSYIWKAGVESDRDWKQSLLGIQEQKAQLED